MIRSILLTASFLLGACLPTLAQDTPAPISSPSKKRNLGSLLKLAKASYFDREAQSAKESGDYTRALYCYDKGLKIYISLSLEEHPLIAILYHNIGFAHKNLGAYPKALEFYGKGLQLNLKLYGSEHPSTADSYYNIGQVHFKMGDYSKALEFLRNRCRSFSRHTALSIHLPRISTAT